MEIDNVLPSIFSKIRQSSTMLVVRSYCNNYNEISDFQVVFHVSYINAVQSSLKLLDRIRTDENWGYVAKEELRQSFIDTLGGRNPRYTCHDIYDGLEYEEDKIKGVKWHIRGSAVHLNGFLLRKRVIVPGTYPIVNSHPKTLEKKRIRGMLPVGRLRQFKLSPGRFGIIKVENLTLTDHDLVKRMVP